MHWAEKRRSISIICTYGINNIKVLDAALALAALLVKVAKTKIKHAFV
jgi:hypothetical protein